MGFPPMLVRLPGLGALLDKLFLSLLGVLALLPGCFVVGVMLCTAAWV